MKAHQAIFHAGLSNIRDLSPHRQPVTNESTNPQQETSQLAVPSSVGQCVSGSSQATLQRKKRVKDLLRIRDELESTPVHSNNKEMNDHDMTALGNGSFVLPPETIKEDSLATPTTITKVMKSQTLASRRGTPFRLNDLRKNLMKHDSLTEITTDESVSEANWGDGLSSSNRGSSHMGSSSIHEYVRRLPFAAASPSSCGPSPFLTSTRPMKSVEPEHEELQTVPKLALARDMDKMITSDIAPFLPTVPFLEVVKKKIAPKDTEDEDSQSLQADTLLEEKEEHEEEFVDDKKRSASLTSSLNVLTPSLADLGFDDNSDFDDGSVDDLLVASKPNFLPKVPWLDLSRTLHDDLRKMGTHALDEETSHSSEDESFACTKHQPEEEGTPATEEEYIPLHERRPADSIQLKDLKKHSILGEGIFGQVWLVTDSKVRSKPYALKVQSKHELAEAEKLDLVIREKEAMVNIKPHPFILDLIKTFQDDHCLYMLLDLVQGGELFSLMHHPGSEGGDGICLPEHQAKFYTLAIADALRHIAQANYAFRDLKPENVLIDDRGYPILIDFGCAKYLGENEMTYTMVGTPGYLAPEVIDTIGHNSSADRWSLGVVLYEMLFGMHPFQAEEMTQMELFESILDDDYVKPDLEETPVTKEAMDLVDKLLVKDPMNRLGNEGIFNHDWFHGMDLVSMRKREVKAPWVPVVHSALDTGYFEDWSDLEDKTGKKYPPLEWRQIIALEDF